MLSELQIADYRQDGFVFPVRVMSAEQASGLRQQLEALERIGAGKALPRPLADYLRVHSECVLPMAVSMALNPAVLDAVECILGPNIMVWGAEYFIKEAHSESIVTMHQDLTYWGFGETSHQVTAWIALSAATVDSGCMNLVRGSHQNPILEHVDTHADNNMLSRGQEVVVDVADGDKTAVVLQPGEMSLHHGLTIHGSGPNTSNDRRIGFAIRYISPAVQQTTQQRQFAIMARGIDDTQNFIHHAPPSTQFSKSSLAIYERIREEQGKVLAAGMAEDKPLFGSTVVQG